MPKISLCVMTGNEECHVIRFLDSFGPAFDELCMVRAVANLPHDKTVSLAKDWCEKNGKGFRFAEYRNRGWQPNLPAALDVHPFMPETWKHVDDFAAARNLSWQLATGDWQLWADLDDVLSPGSADNIRKCAESPDVELFTFTYSIRTSLEQNFRERLFRRGISRWSQPIHENCRVIDGEANCTIKYADNVIYSHEPLAEKPRDEKRNLRIMEYHMRFIDAFPYEMHREYFYRWQHSKKPEDAAKATEWAEIAQQVGTQADSRQMMILNQAQIIGETDPERAIDLCWAAMRMLPWLRDPWGWMAEFEIKRGNGRRAVFFSEFMGKLQKTANTGTPRSDNFYSWRGLHLHTRALRSAGDEAQARKEEAKFFQKNGARFSLLHATRGRPEQALKAREYFFSAAVNALGVEHIFAIDEDDTESLERLKLFRHVVVKNPHGCVKAWNAAAAESTGAVLVQLSDDWLPCLEWDERCWRALGDVSQPKVLAVSDNHRTDHLLCMAILTRARYEQQGFMFSPEYFGVFSDNEFTVRAYTDGVVVDARNKIIFDHRHPVFEGKPVEQWDATHKRQNHPDRYKEGAEIFNRRNPAHAIPA